jgi:O-antigen/teichoic acid export membrane protein
MNKNHASVKTFEWYRPFASTYFRSASTYLAFKLVIFSLAGLATQYLLTHHLAKEDYGLLVWVGTIIALLSPFGLPGISTSITGAVAKGFDGNFRRGTWLEMLGGTVGGLVLLGYAGYHWFWTHEELKALIFVVAGVLGPGLWLDTQQSYWNGKKNFKAIFWWSVPVRLLQLAATATVLYFSSNPLWVFGVQTVIQVVANLGASIGIIKVSQINNNTSKEYQSYGWYFTLLKSLGTFSAYLDKMIIGIFFGLESLAIFAVGQLIYTYFYKTPSSILSHIFMPRLAEMPIKQAAQWVRQRQIYLVLGLCSILIVVGIVIPVVYPLLFSVKYKDSIFYAYLFIGCIILGSPTFLSGSIIKSHAMKKETLISWSILNFTPLILLPIFSWFWGLTGLIAARGFTNLLISVYYFYMIKTLASSNA